MVGKKVVHHLMMSAKDAHYIERYSFCQHYSVYQNKYIFILIIVNIP